MTRNTLIISNIIFLQSVLRLSRGFSMEMFRTHEYGIPLVRGGHLEGPHVFGFLICAFVSEL